MRSLLGVHQPLRNAHLFHNIDVRIVDLTWDVFVPEDSSNVWIVRDDNPVFLCALLEPDVLTPSNASSLYVHGVALVVGEGPDPDVSKAVLPRRCNGACVVCLSCLGRNRMVVLHGHIHLDLRV